MSERPLLVVVTGATASGKTGLAIRLAEHLGTEIVSADSRQIYAGIPLITAAPTPAEQARVRHHLVGTLPLDAAYSAASFEQDALRIASGLMQRTGTAVVCGGSMMYVDALVNGLDAIPTISDTVRRRVSELYESGGLEALLAVLDTADPKYAAEVDRANTRRVMHAVEVCWQAGRPYSLLRKGEGARRPFDVIKFAIDMPRQDLFDRINQRTAKMLAEGMEAEARAVYHLRHLNSLNTVGFKEWFTYFDNIESGRVSDKSAEKRLPSAADALVDPEAVAARIAKNTRVYAKKQLLWLRRYNDLKMLPAASAVADAIRYISERRSQNRPGRDDL